MGDYKAILKDIKKGNRKIELFDLSLDLKEQNDISSEYPEVVRNFENIFKKEHIKSEIKDLKWATLMKQNYHKNE